MPVPEDTRDVKFPAFATGGDQRIQNKQKQATAELANKLATILSKGAKDIAQLSLSLDATGKALLKLNKLTMRKFITIHPETFTLQGRKANLTVKEKAFETGASASSGKQPTRTKVPGRTRLFRRV
jgi:hypothetical protein